MHRWMYVPGPNIALCARGSSGGGSTEAFFTDIPNNESSSLPWGLYNPSHGLAMAQGSRMFARVSPGGIPPYIKKHGHSDQDKHRGLRAQDAAVLASSVTVTPSLQELEQQVDVPVVPIITQLHRPYQRSFPMPVYEARPARLQAGSNPSTTQPSGRTNRRSTTDSTNRHQPTNAINPPSVAPKSAPTKAVSRDGKHGTVKGKARKGKKKGAGADKVVDEQEQLLNQLRSRPPLPELPTTKYLMQYKQRQQEQQGVDLDVTIRADVGDTGKRVPDVVDQDVRTHVQTAAAAQGLWAPEHMTTATHRPASPSITGQPAAAEGQLTDRVHQVVTTAQGGAGESGSPTRTLDGCMELSFRLVDDTRAMPAPVHVTELQQAGQQQQPVGDGTEVEAAQQAEQQQVIQVHDEVVHELVQVDGAGDLLGFVEQATQTEAASPPRGVSPSRGQEPPVLAPPPEPELWIPTQQRLDERSSRASSVCLEELEQLVEQQHQQLVQAGILLPSLVDTPAPPASSAWSWPTGLGLEGVDVSTTATGGQQSVDMPSVDVLDATFAQLLAVGSVPSSPADSPTSSGWSWSKELSRLGQMSSVQGDAPTKGSLPAAQAEQVVQYLLAHKYHLTALELLVESQGAGHNGEFPELEAFFNNPEAFPAEEVARYAHSNALEIQASARDREQKLQLLEYELRVTKEDLQGLTRRMSVPTGTPNGSVPASPRVCFTPGTLPSADSTGVTSRMSAGAAGSAFRHVAAESAGKAGTSVGHVTSTATEPDELQSGDWQQLGDPSEADHLAVLPSLVSYCFHLGLRSSALTLQEEASDMLPGLSLSRGAQQTDGLMVWRWFKVARSALAAQGGPADSQAASEAEALRQQVSELQAALARTEEQLAAAHTAASEAQAEVSSLKQQLTAAVAEAQAVDNTILKAQHQQLVSANSADPTRSATPGLSSGAITITNKAAAGAGGDLGDEGVMHKAIVSQLTELLPKVMPALTIKTRLEILPMVQAVILASRDADTQRALTGLVFNGVATPDPVQRGAVVALCAGVAAKLGPNWAAQELLGTCTKHVASASAERRVLVAEMLAALMDPRSVAVLQMGVHKGVLSSSGAASTGPGGSTGVVTGSEAGVKLEGPLIDCGAQASALLHAVTRLAEDRMEQVREAAVIALVALLQPTCLPFSQAHYSAVEDLVLLLVCDSQTVSASALQSLVPAFQTWCAHTDLVASSLLPRIITDITRLSREAPPVPTASNTPGTATSPAPAGGSSGGAPPDRHHASTVPLPSLSTVVSSGPTSPPISQLGSRQSVGVAKSIFAGPPPGALCAQKFACWEHQAMHELLELAILLLPALSTSALKTVPGWIVAAAAGDAPTNGHVSGPASQEATQRTEYLLGSSPAQPSHASSHVSPFGSVSNPGGQDGAQQDGATTLPGADGGSTGCGAGEGYTTPGSTTGGKRRSSGSSSMNTFVVHQEITSTMELLGGGSTARGEGGLSLDAMDAVAQGELDPHMMFAAWAMSDKGHQWKRMQWVLQFLLHELLQLTRALGVPSHHPPARPPASDATKAPPQTSQAYTSSLMPYTPAATTVLASLSDSCYELHCQLARVVASIATTFGQGWTQAVLLPVYCSAAACAVPDLYNGQSSSTILEAAEQLAPQTPAAAQAARACVLPHLITAVLPYSLESALPDWMLSLTQANPDLPPSYHQMPAFFGLLQPAGVPLVSQWVQAARQQLAAAVSFACIANTALVSRLLQVLERLAQRKSTPAATTPLPTKPSSHSPHTSMAAPLQLSGLPGALALSLAHGLLSFVINASSNEQGEPQMVMPTLPASETPQPDPQQLSPATTADGSSLPADTPGGQSFHEQHVLPLARKVMSLLMIMLGEGDGEVQSGVVGVLLEVLMHYKSHNNEDVKLVEQVCVVYDGLLASGSPMLVGSVLNAVQQLASTVGATASSSHTAAQQIEWVLQVVFSLASQQLPPPPAGPPTPTPYPTDQQRQLACQLLNVTHAVFMHDIRVASIQTALHACVDALVKVRGLLPDPYSAVLTPMQANNRQAAGAAMSNAVAAAAAMSAITAQPSAGHWGAPGLLSVGAAAPKPPAGSAPALAPPYGQPGGQFGLSPQQQQYLQYQQKQQQSMSVGNHGTLHQQQVMNQQQAALPTLNPAVQAAAPQLNSTLQATAQNLGLTDRLERLRSRFRKKSVADGELDS